MNKIQKIITSMAVILMGTILAIHNPFGGYEREKVLYSKSEFLNLFREAFPEYSDIKDEDLYIRLLEKSPELKTWIIEESDGSDVKPLTLSKLPTNYRLKPPPAYYGKQTVLKSKNAFFKWLDEPYELIGFEILSGVVGVIFFIIFRR